MSKELNILQAIEMPVGTEFEVVFNNGNKRLIKTVLDKNRNFVAEWAGNLEGATHDFVTAKFIPIQKPVSFMEAVKAYSDGKTIRCDYKEFNGEETTNIYKYGGIDKPIEDTCNFGISTREILNGKWYIKEEFINE